MEQQAGARTTAASQVYRYSTEVVDVFSGPMSADKTMAGGTSQSRTGQDKRAIETFFDADKTVLGQGNHSSIRIYAEQQGAVAASLGVGPILTNTPQRERGSGHDNPDRVSLANEKVLFQVRP